MIPLPDCPQNRGKPSCQEVQDSVSWFTLPTAVTHANAANAVSFDKYEMGDAFHLYSSIHPKENDVCFKPQSVCTSFCSPETHFRRPQKSQKNCQSFCHVFDTNCSNCRKILLRNRMPQMKNEKKSAF